MAAPGTGAWAKFPTPELEKMANDPGRSAHECDEILAEIGYGDAQIIQLYADAIVVGQ